MKTAASLLLGVLVSAAAHAEAGDIRCLTSATLKNPVRLEFGFPSGKSKRGYVRYQHGSANIPVQLIRSEEVELTPGRPSEVTTTWKEIGPPGSGGTYNVVSQGARIYDFTYMRARDRKTFTSSEEEAPYTETGCVWDRE